MNLTDEMLHQYAGEARDIWLSTLPHRNEVPEHPFSRRFIRKMNRLIREQRRSPRMRHVMRYARNAAIFVLVLLPVAFSSVMSVEAYRAAVVHVITNIFTDRTELQYSTAISAEDTEFPEVSFEYLPEGMEEVESERLRYDDYRYTYFENTAGDFFDLTETLFVSEGAYDMMLDTENAIVKNLTIMGTDALFIEKNGDKIITWTYGNVRYDLYGNVSSRELEKVACSIELK